MWRDWTLTMVLLWFSVVAMLHGNHVVAGWLLIGCCGRHQGDILASDWLFWRQQRSAKVISVAMRPGRGGRLSLGSWGRQQGATMSFPGSVSIPNINLPQNGQVECPSKQADLEYPPKGKDLLSSKWSHIVCLSLKKVISILFVDNYLCTYTSEDDTLDS